MFQTTPGSPLWSKEKIKPIVIQEGVFLVLPCRPPAGFPPPIVFWMDNSKLLHTHMRRHTLRLRKWASYEMFPCIWTLANNSRKTNVIANVQLSLIAVMGCLHIRLPAVAPKQQGVPVVERRPLLRQRASRGLQERLHLLRPLPAHADHPAEATHRRQGPQP